MYKILLVDKKCDEIIENTYRWYTQINPETQQIEIYTAANLQDVDTQVEKMLNEEGYAKSDFIIVSTVDYTVFANID